MPDRETLAVARIPEPASTRASEDAAPRSAHGALVLNPLRSEGEAFRLLLYVLAVAVAVILIVLAARAIF